MKTRQTYCLAGQKKGDGAEELITHHSDKFQPKLQNTFREKSSTQVKQVLTYAEDANKLGEKKKKNRPNGIQVDVHFGLQKEAYFYICFLGRLIPV